MTNLRVVPTDLPPGFWVRWARFFCGLLQECLRYILNQLSMLNQSSLPPCFWPEAWGRGRPFLIVPGSRKAKEKQCYWVVTGSSGVSTASGVFLSVSAECMKGACFMYLPFYVPELQWYLHYTQTWCYGEQFGLSLKIDTWFCSTFYIYLWNCWD